MNILPVARGLFVCEHVIVEAATSNVSLINCFARKHVRSFPSPKVGFAVFSMLSGGLGSVTMKVEINEPFGRRLIYSRAMMVDFNDRAKEVRFVLRLSEVQFPVAGDYSVILMANGELIAQTRVEIVE